MGIVVSSRQACNIFWHSVTRLNAICVLISSLQRLRPLEKRGVRWFSFFHSPAWFFPSVCRSLRPRYNAPLLSPLSFATCPLFWIPCLLHLYPRVSREDSFHQTEALSIVFVPLSVISCHDRDRSTGIQMCRLPVHPHIAVPVPWDSGVHHASLLSFYERKKSKWAASERATNETAGRCLFFFFLTPRLCCSFLSFLLSLRSGPLSIQSAAVFIWVRNHLSCIWHLDKVGARRGKMRADDGERQLTVSGDMRRSPFSFFFFPPLSYLRLHSNRLTNVPWTFTLDTGSRRSERRLGAAARRLDSDVEAARTHFFFFFLSRVVVEDLLMESNIIQDVEV